MTDSTPPEHGSAGEPSGRPPPPTPRRGSLFGGIVTAERSAEPLATYGRTCEAMRDTTKWILSFLPGAALIVTLAGVVPDVAALRPSDRVAPIAWLVAAACLVGIATALAVWVLAADPPGWNWIYKTYADETEPGARRPERSFSAELDRSGILHLFGYLKARDFFAAINEQRDGHIKSARGPGATILDFAYLRDLRRRFVVFVAVGSVAAAGAVACLAVARGVTSDEARARAAAASAQPPKVDAPVPARVFPTASGLRRLGAAHCVEGAASDGVAVWVVAGSLEEATLIVADHGCAPTTLRRWIAATEGVVVPTSD